ncbi:hypothetical protein A1Q1_00378 [Trichosporon asahii var. asahii CBS 2479]|uniref:Calpain catalytic domain-containing protein n=1 Tax=Trichosporon asahii var. asahii (strain ATCC 90039 / CBS 2479 / JCM 2466 / KCTC 7840 / NBRC 103889/ NCYC 2677 / UAMH 7654) TaxID=1186058 RepID=J6F4Z9_TRIAS|nr:hypothetical protein A1Q1_00378 [Trichosporon asahii var. asahii CBS 2479]EJT50357.1 hypothetical protein A1Q1_00378 [Trichosporon asahii var. asahii CBS 2479]
MASRIWLALLLFQLATAAPTPADGAVAARDVEAFSARDTLLERDGEENWSKYGTNKNSPLIGTPAREPRAGVDYVKALLDPTKQPALFKDSPCDYAYSRQATSGPLNLWEKGSSPLVDTNVAQGGVGDCGFGSSIGAIALTGHSQYLKDRVKVNGTTWEFKFTWLGKDHIVRVDDQLPAKIGGPDWCNRFLGYQPAGPSKSWYVPLVEKAAAKLLDAYPEIRSYPDQPGGYNAMQGIWPHKALEILTGRSGKRLNREFTGLDDNLIKALEKCLTGPEPCVVGTPSVEYGDNFLGSASFNGEAWEVPDGAPFVSGVFSNSTSAPDFWDSIDYDLKSAHNTIVPSHAWAIDKRNTNYTPGADIRKVKVRILNPWGKNVKPWAQTNAINAIDISFSTLVSLITALFTVEDI